MKIEERFNRVLAGLSHTGYTTEIEKCEARIFIEELYRQNQKYKEVIDKVIDKLQLLIDIGFDYDGFNQVNSLKTLIDELVGYAKESRNILKEVELMISGASDEELDIAIARADVLLELQPKIDELKKENQELKKQLDELQTLYKNMFKCHCNKVQVETLLEQQKEFIEYLKNKEKEFDMMGDPINSGACLGILREYKEIIGGKDE